MTFSRWDKRFNKNSKSEAIDGKWDIFQWRSFSRSRKNRGVRFFETKCSETHRKTVQDYEKGIDVCAAFNWPWLWIIRSLVVYEYDEAYNCNWYCLLRFMFKDETKRVIHFKTSWPPLQTKQNRQVNLQNKEHSPKAPNMWGFPCLTRLIQTTPSDFRFAGTYSTTEYIALKTTLCVGFIAVSDFLVCYL